MPLKEKEYLAPSIKLGNAFSNNMFSKRSIIAVEYQSKNKVSKLTIA